MKSKLVGGLFAAATGAAAALPLPAMALGGAGSAAQSATGGSARPAMSAPGGGRNMAGAPAASQGSWHPINGEWAWPHRHWRRHRAWARPVYAAPAAVWTYPYWYDPATYHPWCWQQIWHLYGWQWINICYGY